jgi:hypothetical protein
MKELAETKAAAAAAENQRKQLVRTLQVQTVNRKHVDSKPWVAKLEYLPPIYAKSTEESIQLTGFLL